MKRSTFIRKTSAAILIGIPFISIWSCGDDEDDPGNGGPNNGGVTLDCGQNGTNSVIAANHGHTLTVSADDVNAGVEKTYDIQGGSAHAHQVTVTVADFAELQQNRSVTATSTSGSGHTHNVTINCA